MQDPRLAQGTHYTYRNRTDELALFTESERYFLVLRDAITTAERRILIVGWSLDDRITLVRDDTDDSRSTDRQSLGELLVDRAREEPGLRVQLRIWHAPGVFAADQYITDWFQEQARALDNLDFVRVPASSAFAARHEKYVIVDDSLAWVGGIDLSHNRWDTMHHVEGDPARTNPDGGGYVPYHDTQLLFTGPLVRDLFTAAVEDDLVDDDWNPRDPPRWPSDLPVELRNREVLLSFTRSAPESDDNDVQQIAHLYRNLVTAAEERIYIENQYFSSDEITRALAARLAEPEGPEVIIVISRELPDALGRMTMGVNSSIHLSQLIKHDRFNRLGVFHPFSTGDGSASVKVHSKTMIVDGAVLTLGSANISRRSFSLDAEVNATILSEDDADRPKAADAVPAPPAGNAASAAPGGVAAVEDRLIAQHAGLTVEAWRQLVARSNGSRLAALRERVPDWPGLDDGREYIVAEAPSRLPKEIVERFDMDRPPLQETVFQRIARSNPWEIIARTRRIWMVLLVTIAAIGGLLYAAQSDFDIRSVLQTIEDINTQRPVAGALLTIGAFWVTMAGFVTIIVPIVFFSALHGPVLGIAYSTLGIFSGAAIFYAIGLALHTSSWPDRYRAVRRAKTHLERIKPYGLWAVAISRMVPSGPFLVVNLVTGLLGFSPLHFLAGSAVGLLPGIIAFSIFGEVIRNVFTDPGLMSTIWFVVFVVGYFAGVRGLLAVVRRIAGWTRGDTNE